MKRPVIIVLTLSLALGWMACGDDSTDGPVGPPSPHRVVELFASLDNTMYEESDTLSNAKGQHLYSGNNAAGAQAPPDARRALIAFPIAGSIPSGAVIDSVHLVLNMSKKAPSSATAVSPASVHRLLNDWGEGTSVANLAAAEGAGGVATAGDATWLDRFRGTSLWTAPGGDFVATASATIQTDALGKYTWSSPAMTADVQSWFDDPASNFGWIVIGDEATAKNARQWDSRENTIQANRPKLKVFYTVAP